MAWPGPEVQRKKYLCTHCSFLENWPAHPTPEKNDRSDKAPKKMFLIVFSVVVQLLDEFPIRSAFFQFSKSFIKQFRGRIGRLYQVLKRNDRE